MIIAAAQPPTVASIVTRAVQPLMQRYGIPGMAVGVVVNGRTYVLNYGVASRATRAKVNAATLFEIGSVSKTFTATLASYAQLTGRLSFADMASADLPALRGSSFDRVSLLNLGTHTAGGLPLQVPDDVTDDAQLISYLRGWKPPYPPGTQRLYSNVSIGLLGFITAARANEDFIPLMQRTIFQPLGLQHTYLDVPAAQMANYAQGYTSNDAPIRMKAGELYAETYGVRTTAGDLTRWLQANMAMLPLDATLQRAITNTHAGYYRSGAMIQDLIWEQYSNPVTLAQLEQGNAATMLLDAHRAIAIDPPRQPSGDVVLNKTGSTYGFSTYVVFVPSKKIGVVLLANKSYPIAARVSTAYQILRRL
ncbi:MAG TPA: class C beta-lactamase [Verrucomicrobiae bacterium]|nr:class C beta-lactamase [Verrucomicrobiae bacterium]